MPRWHRTAAVANRRAGCQPAPHRASVSTSMSHTLRAVVGLTGVGAPRAASALMPAPAAPPWVASSADTLGYSRNIMDTFPPTGRTTVRRLPQRGVYDKARVYAILDEGFICHVGFAFGGQPYVIPTGYARSGDEIFLHGSAASRMLGALGDGLDVCVTVTLVDGFVLSRSAFHHSINYRSVVIMGRA